MWEHKYGIQICSLEPSLTWGEFPCYHIHLVLRLHSNRVIHSHSLYFSGLPTLGLTTINTLHKKGSPILGLPVQGTLGITHIFP